MYAHDSRLENNQTCGRLCINGTNPMFHSNSVTKILITLIHSLLSGTYIVTIASTKEVI